MTMKLTTLANGLRVVSSEMAGLETATVGLFADTGLAARARPLNGLAHLFEHMVFKGAGTRSAREISEAIEDVGGELNACTERDGTSFTASVLAEHVPLAVELIADMIPAALHRGRARAREGRRAPGAGRGARTPRPTSSSTSCGAPLRRPAARPLRARKEASIGRITTDDLHRWRTERFRGGSLILAAGKVSHDALVELAERHLGELPAGEAQAGRPALFTGGARVKRTPSEQAQLTLAFEGAGALAPDYFCRAAVRRCRRRRRIVAAVPGAARGARPCLFGQREPPALRRDTGLFYVHAATARRDPQRPPQLIDEVLDEPPTTRPSASSTACARRRGPGC
jgi:predicted Zn-dependent peptidase